MDCLWMTTRIRGSPPRRRIRYRTNSQKVRHRYSQIKSNPYWRASLGMWAGLHLIGISTAGTRPKTTPLQVGRLPPNQTRASGSLLAPLNPPFHAFHIFDVVLITHSSERCSFGRNPCQAFASCSDVLVFAALDGASDHAHRIDISIS